MTDIQSLLDTAAALNTSLTVVKTKLDAIAALVAALQAGGLVTQAQIDALGAALGDASTAVADIQTEEDVVNPPTP